MNELEDANKIAERHVAKLTGENEALRKEVDKLRYVGDLRNTSDHVRKPSPLQLNDSVRSVPSSTQKYRSVLQMWPAQTFQTKLS